MRKILKLRNTRLCLAFLFLGTYSISEVYSSASPRDVYTFQLATFPVYFAQLYDLCLSLSLFSAQAAHSEALNAGIEDKTVEKARSWRGDGGYSTVQIA